MPPVSPIVSPAYPGSMVDKDLQFSSLVEGMIADDIYFGIGTYSETDINTLYATRPRL